MRMSITLDKELLEEAQKLGASKTKKAVIEKALKEFIRKKRREKALEHAGNVQIDLTLEELLRQREEG